MNCEILGNDIDLVQWDCQSVNNGLMVGALTMDNNRARKIVQNMEKLFELSFTCEDHKQQFLFAIRKFNAALY